MEQESGRSVAGAPVHVAAPAPRRRLVGLLVGVVVLVVVAIPAAFCAAGAYLLLAHPEILPRDSPPPPPDVAGGALFSACTLVLLALPVVAGVVAGRVSRRRESRRGRVLWAAFSVLALVAFIAGAAAVAHLVGAAT